MQEETKQDLNEQDYITSSKKFILEILFDLFFALIFIFLPQLIDLVARKPLCIGTANLLVAMRNYWPMAIFWIIVWFISSLSLNIAKLKINLWNKSMFKFILSTNIVSFIAGSAFFYNFFQTPGVEATIFGKIPYVGWLIIGLLAVIHLLDIKESYNKCISKD